MCTGTHLNCAYKLNLRHVDGDPVTAQATYLPWGFQRHSSCLGYARQLKGSCGLGGEGAPVLEMPVSSVGGQLPRCRIPDQDALACRRAVMLGVWSGGIFELAMEGGSCCITYTILWKTRSRRMPRSALYLFLTRRYVRLTCLPVIRPWIGRSILLLL